MEEDTLMDTFAKQIYAETTVENLYKIFVELAETKSGVELRDRQGLGLLHHLVIVSDKFEGNPEALARLLGVLLQAMPEPKKTGKIQIPREKFRAQDILGRTPLHMLAEKGSLKLLSLWLDTAVLTKTQQKLEVNKANSSGFTFLHLLRNKLTAREISEFVGKYLQVVPLGIEQPSQGETMKTWLESELSSNLTKYVLQDSIPDIKDCLKQIKKCDLNYLNILTYPELKYNLLRFALSKDKLESVRAIISDISEESKEIIGSLFSQQDDNRKSFLNDLLHYGSLELIEFLYSLHSKFFHLDSSEFLVHSLVLNTKIKIREKFKLLKKIFNDESARRKHFNLVDKNGFNVLGFWIHELIRRHIALTSEIEEIIQYFLLYTDSDIWRIQDLIKRENKEKEKTLSRAIPSRKVYPRPHCSQPPFTRITHTLTAVSPVEIAIRLNSNEYLEYFVIKLGFSCDLICENKQHLLKVALNFDNIKLIATILPKLRDSEYISQLEHLVAELYDKRGYSRAELLHPSIFQFEERLLSSILHQDFAEKVRNLYCELFGVPSDNMALSFIKMKEAIKKCVENPSQLSIAKQDWDERQFVDNWNHTLLLQDFFLNLKPEDILTEETRLPLWMAQQIGMKKLIISIFLSKFKGREYKSLKSHIYSLMLNKYYFMEYAWRVSEWTSDPVFLQNLIKFDPVNLIDPSIGIKSTCEDIINLLTRAVVVMAWSGYHTLVESLLEFQQKLIKIYFLSIMPKEIKIESTEFLFCYVHFKKYAKKYQYSLCPQIFSPEWIIGIKQYSDFYSKFFKTLARECGRRSFLDSPKNESVNRKITLNYWLFNLQISDKKFNKFAQLLECLKDPKILFEENKMIVPYVSYYLFTHSSRKYSTPNLLKIIINTGSIESLFFVLEQILLIKPSIIHQICQAQISSELKCQIVEKYFSLLSSQSKSKYTSKLFELRYLKELNRAREDQKEKLSEIYNLLQKNTELHSFIDFKYGFALNHLCRALNPDFVFEISQKYQLPLNIVSFELPDPKMNKLKKPVQQLLCREDLRQSDWIALKTQSVIKTKINQPSLLSLPTQKVRPREKCIRRSQDIEKNTAPKRTKLRNRTRPHSERTVSYLLTFPLFELVKHKNYNNTKSISLQIIKMPIAYKRIMLNNILHWFAKFGVLSQVIFEDLWCYRDSPKFMQEHTMADLLPIFRVLAVHHNPIIMRNVLLHFLKANDRQFIKTIMSCWLNSLCENKDIKLMYTLYALKIAFSLGVGTPTVIQSQESAKESILLSSYNLPLYRFMLDYPKEIILLWDKINSFGVPEIALNIKKRNMYQSLLHPRVYVVLALNSPKAWSEYSRLIQNLAPTLGLNKNNELYQRAQELITTVFKLKTHNFSFLQSDLNMKKILENEGLCEMSLLKPLKKERYNASYYETPIYPGISEKDSDKTLYEKALTLSTPDIDKMIKSRSWTVSELNNIRKLKFTSASKYCTLSNVVCPIVSSSAENVEIWLSNFQLIGKELISSISNCPWKCEDLHFFASCIDPIFFDSFQQAIEPSLGPSECQNVIQMYCSCIRQFSRCPINKKALEQIIRKCGIKTLFGSLSSCFLKLIDLDVSMIPIDSLRAILEESHAKIIFSQAVKQKNNLMAIQLLNQFPTLHQDLYFMKPVDLKKQIFIDSLYPLFCALKYHNTEIAILIIKKLNTVPHVMNYNNSHFHFKDSVRTCRKTPVELSIITNNHLIMNYLWENEYRAYILENIDNLQLLCLECGRIIQYEFLKNLANYTWVPSQHIFAACKSLSDSFVMSLCMNCDLEILLKHQDDEGNNILHIISKYGRRNLLYELVLSKNLITMDQISKLKFHKNKNNIVPFILAYQQKYVDIANFLEFPVPSLESISETEFSVMTTQICPREELLKYLDPSAYPIENRLWDYLYPNREAILKLFEQAKLYEQNLFINKHKRPSPEKDVITYFLQCLQSGFVSEIIAFLLFRRSALEVSFKFDEEFRVKDNVYKLVSSNPNTLSFCAVLFRIGAIPSQKLILDSWENLRNDEMALLFTQIFGILHHNTLDQLSSDKYSDLSSHKHFSKKRAKIFGLYRVEEFCSILNLGMPELSYWELDITHLIYSMLPRAFYHTFSLYFEYYCTHYPEKVSNLDKYIQQEYFFDLLFNLYPQDLPMWISILGQKMTLTYCVKSNTVYYCINNFFDLSTSSSLNLISVMFYYFIYHSGDLLMTDPIQDMSLVSEDLIVKLLQRVFWISSLDSTASLPNSVSKHEIPNRTQIDYASGLLSKVLELVKEMASSRYHTKTLPLISDELLSMCILRAFISTNFIYQDEHQLTSYSFDYQDCYNAAKLISNSCSDSLPQSMLKLLSNKFIFGIIPKRENFQRYFVKINLKFAEESEAYQYKILSVSKEIGIVKGNYYLFTEKHKLIRKNSELFHVNLEYIINPIAGMEHLEKLDELNEKLYVELQYRCLKASEKFNFPISPIKRASSSLTSIQKSLIEGGLEESKSKTRKAKFEFPQQECAIIVDIERKELEPMVHYYYSDIVERFIQLCRNQLTDVSDKIGYIIETKEKLFDFDNIQILKHTLKIVTGASINYLKTSHYFISRSLALLEQADRNTENEMLAIINQENGKPELLYESHILFPLAKLHQLNQQFQMKVAPRYSQSSIHFKFFKLLNVVIMPFLQRLHKVRGRGSNPLDLIQNLLESSVLLPGVINKYLQQLEELFNLEDKKIEIDFEACDEEPRYDPHLFSGVDSFLPLINVVCTKDKAAFQVCLFYNLNYCKERDLEEATVDLSKTVVNTNLFEQSVNSILHDIQVFDDLMEDKELIRILYKKKLGDFPVDAKQVSLLFGATIKNENDWDSLESALCTKWVTPKSHFKFPEERGKYYSQKAEWIKKLHCLLDNLASPSNINHLIQTLEPQIELLLEHYLLTESRDVFNRDSTFVIDLNQISNFQNISRVNIEQSRTNWNLQLMKKVNYATFKALFPKIIGTRCSFIWHVAENNRINFYPVKIENDNIFYGKGEFDWICKLANSIHGIYIPCTPKTMSIIEFVNIPNYYISGLHNIMYKISKKNFDLLYDDYLSSDYTLKKLLPFKVIHRYYSTKEEIKKTGDRENFVIPYYLDKEYFKVQPIPFYETSISSRTMLNKRSRKFIFDFCSQLLEICKMEKDTDYPKIYFDLAEIEKLSELDSRGIPYTLQFAFDNVIESTKKLVTNLSIYSFIQSFNKIDLEQLSPIPSTYRIKKELLEIFTTYPLHFVLKVVSNPQNAIVEIIDKQIQILIPLFNAPDSFFVLKEFKDTLINLLIEILIKKTVEEYNLEEMKEEISAPILDFFNIKKLLLEYNSEIKLKIFPVVPQFSLPVLSAIYSVPYVLKYIYDLARSEESKSTIKSIEIAFDNNLEKSWHIEHSEEGRYLFKSNPWIKGTVQIADKENIYSIV